MTIREGKWKCTYCDELNRGRDIKCQACGAAREQDVEFIYDENAPEVTDEAQLQAARGGADWLCETCGTSNPNSRNECKQCSAPRGSSRQREVKMVGEKPPAPPPPAPSKFPFKILGIVAIAIFICCSGMLFYFTRTHDAELSVESVEWQRTVEVEQLQTLTKEDWQNDVPSDARVISRRSEFHHNDKVQVGTHSEERTVKEEVQTGTKRVKTGTKNLGNGHFEDVYENQPVYQTRTRRETVQEPTYVDKPVYKDKVKYQVDRWVTVRTDKTAGNDNSPAWPKIDEGAKLRAGKRTEKYQVNFKDRKSGQAYQHEATAAEFAGFVPGSVFRASINNFGTIKNLTRQK